MNQITQLQLADTFETWFNRTKSVITELNNANPKLISVRDFGATGNGVADDSTAIRAAFDAANAITGPGGVLYFPRGNYLMGTTISGGGEAFRRVLLKQLSNPMYILGDGAKITCGITCCELWYILANNKNLKIEGIEFDGALKAQYALRIDEQGNGGISYTNKLIVQNCEFNNTFGNGLFTDQGNAGLYVAGPFEYVNLNNSSFKNHSRANVGSPGNAGSVAAAVQKFSSSPYVGPPASVNVHSCYFDTVTSGWTSHDINNVDCDCLSVFGHPPELSTDPAGGITYSTTVANITNNIFRNCKGRAIKIQTDHALVANNSIYRNIPTIWGGAADINTQFSVGKISNNSFWYQGTGDPASPSPFGPFGTTLSGSSCINTFNGFRLRTRSISIINNNVVIDVPRADGRLNVFFNTSRRSASPPLGFTGALFATISGNQIVGGPIRFFGAVGTSSQLPTHTPIDTGDTYYNITENMIEEIADIAGVSHAFLYSSENVRYQDNNFNIMNNVVSVGPPVKHLISSTTTVGLNTHFARINAINNINIGITSETFHHSQTSAVPRLGFISDIGSAADEGVNVFTPARGGVVSTQSIGLTANSGYYIFPKRGVDFAGKVRLLTSDEGKDTTFMFIQHGKTSTHTPIGFTGAAIVVQPNMGITQANKINVVLVDGDVAISNELPAGASRNFTLTTFG